MDRSARASREPARASGARAETQRSPTAARNDVSPRGLRLQATAQLLRDGPASVARLRTLQAMFNSAAPRRRSAPAPAPKVLDSQAPVQMYSTAHGYKISEGSQYAVPTAAANQLYALHDPAGPGGGRAAAPAPAALVQASGNTAAIGGYTYAEYTYTQAFVNDCLAFAENVARGTDQDSARPEFRARENRAHGGDRLFGHSHAQNTLIANSPNFHQGEATDPAIGEAYSTVRTAQGVGTPYHAAAVVAKDAPDNVTVEADAGNVGAVAPVFDMYDTTPAAGGGRTVGSITFHETYSAAYTTGGHAPATGVLYRRAD